MEDVFISKIHINKVRHLENLEIPLSDTERKHLILTGRNGSGKTSVLLALKTFIDSTLTSGLTFEKLQEIYRLVGRSQNITNDLTGYCHFNALDNIYFTYKNEPFIFAFFGADRLFPFKVPSGPKKIKIKSSYRSDEKANTDFMQHMANLRFNYLNAAFDKDKSTEKTVEKWVHNFQKFLMEIFEDPKLQMSFDSQNFKYDIHSKGKIFDLSTLSDGFSSIINIVTELMMRMEHKNRLAYDVQGVVFIDEIETHLHIELQKKILPFLTSFFPKIQFIVTTHSPFVLTSLENAIIYDLESQEPIEDLSGYSVEAIIEGYFGGDKYSEALKEKVDEYEQLMSNPDLSSEEADELRSLERFFDDLSGVFAEELKLKLEQIRLLNPVK